MTDDGCLGDVGLALMVDANAAQRWQMTDDSPVDGWELMDDGSQVKYDG